MYTLSFVNTKTETATTSVHKDLADLLNDLGGMGEGSFASDINGMQSQAKIGSTLVRAVTHHNEEIVVVTRIR